MSDALHLPQGASLWRLARMAAGWMLLMSAAGLIHAAPTPPVTVNYALTPDTPVNAGLQAALEQIDLRLRARHAMPAERTAVGVLDLKTLRLAWIRPDAIEYAASVPKIAILLAWVTTHPEAIEKTDPVVRHELGLMIKVSDNAMASKYSQPLGLQRIQEVLNSYGFYDAERGGGIWMGKHYAKSGERVRDPVGNHSHAATVRQLLRFYLLLEQGKLVSPAASRLMREIFASPDIPHLNDKFVKGLAGRDVQVLRKAGWWESWFHDTAIVTGANRHYILVALTQHPNGDAYLPDLAAEVDDLMK